MFGVTILGNNSALPAHDRHPTSQLVTLNDQLFLIDCGEGTQMQLSRYRVRRSKINHILISHLHGDHYFGLPGLLTSFGLMSRENDLHIHAPEPLKQMLDRIFEAGDTRLPYTIHFHPLLKEGTIAESERFSIECFRVYHRIECWGFLIREKKKPRKILIEKTQQYEIPATFFERLKEGHDYTNQQGETISNDLVTTAAPPARSYAFCADTLYNEAVSEKVKNVTLLYHETTYLKDAEERALSRHHSTTEQAGLVAKLANAKKLLIGHFSSKYEQLDDFFTETSAVFPDTQLALEGVTYMI